MQIIPKCEGKESEEDYSYEILQMNPQFVQMEKGILIEQFESKLQDLSLYVKFQVLSYMTQTSRHTSTKLFKDPVQFSYNRYDNILPYEYSMVRLGNDNSDPINYINANYITTVVKDYNFIATQGPLTSTVTNFWKMVEQNDVEIIMMFCNLEEKNKVKCYKYWPSKDIQGGILDLSDNFSVQFIEEEQIKQHLVKRKFILKRNEKLRQVIQYHWKNWIDHSAPKEEDSQYLDFLLNISIQSAKCHKKIVTHCSGGVGRTGTFISLFNIRITLNYFKQHQQQIEKEKRRISIFATVRRLREQRWRMVFVLQQYQFIYAFTLQQIKRLQLVQQKQ